MLYDVDNQVLNLIGLPHSVSAAGQASRMEMGAWHALRSEVSQFETGTAVQRAAMLGSAALFVAESLGAGGAVSGVGRLALNASRFGRVGLFGRTVDSQAPSKAKIGQKVYRIWGDGANSHGRSWTRTDPASIPHYRDLAGLPDQNSGRFITEGRIKNIDGLSVRLAIPLHGNSGGLDEVIVPNPEKQIEIERVSGVNPSF